MAGCVYDVNWRVSETLAGLFNGDSLYVYYSTYGILRFDLITLKEGGE